MFDPLIQLERTSSEELAHLSYFGVRDLIGLATFPAPPASGQELCAFWDEVLCRAHPARARAHGITLHPALALTPASQPRRTFARAIDALESRLATLALPILGLLEVPADPGEAAWGGLESQLRLLSSHPSARALVRVPQRLAINQTYALIERLEAAQLPGAHIAVLVPTVALAEVVARHGLWPILDMQGGVEVGQIAQALAASEPLSHRLMCASGLHREARDILALPKAKAGLIRHQVPEADRFVREHARRFLGLW